MRRSYGQYCALAKALDVVGERWTLLIVRELLAGPRRYTDLVEGLPGIGTSLLAERLKHLEDEGIVLRRTLPPPAASTVYELTDDGVDLGTALVPLVQWGARRLKSKTRGDAFQLGWLLAFLRNAVNTDASRGVREIYQFRVDDEPFFVRADDGRVDIVEGAAPEPPTLVVSCDLTTFVGLGYGTVTSADAITSGRMTAQGDPEAGLRCLAIMTPTNARSASA